MYMYVCFLYPNIAVMLSAFLYLQVIYLIYQDVPTHHRVTTIPSQNLVINTDRYSIQNVR